MKISYSFRACKEITITMDVELAKEILKIISSEAAKLLKDENFSEVRQVMYNCEDLKENIKNAESYDD